MNPSPVGKPPPRPATATSRLRWSRPAIHQLQTNQLRRNRTKSSQSAADLLLEGSLQGYQRDQERTPNTKHKHFLVLNHSQAHQTKPPPFSQHPNNFIPPEFNSQTQLNQQSGISVAPHLNHQALGQYTGVLLRPDSNKQTQNLGHNSTVPHSNQQAQVGYHPQSTLPGSHQPPPSSNKHGHNSTIPLYGCSALGLTTGVLSYGILTSPNTSVAPLSLATPLPNWEQLNADAEASLENLEKESQNADSALSTSNEKKSDQSNQSISSKSQLRNRITRDHTLDNQDYLIQNQAALLPQSKSQHHTPRPFKPPTIQTTCSLNTHNSNTTNTTITSPDTQTTPQRNGLNPLLGRSCQTCTVAGKDKDYIKCPQFNGNNFPIWKNKVLMFLRVKRLLKCIENRTQEEASQTKIEEYAEAACILGCHVSDEVYNHIINSNNIANAYTIWTDLQREYTSSSFLAIFRAWCKWKDVQYSNNMFAYVAGMEAVLSEFATMGLDMPPKILSCAIIAKITRKRSTLMETLISNKELLSHPKKIIAKLLDIANHDVAAKAQAIKSTPGTLSALYNHAPNQSQDHALTSQQRAPSSNKRKRPNPHPCKNGHHNPNATTHTEDNCWTLYPDKYKAAQAAKTPAAGLVTTASQPAPTGNPLGNVMKPASGYVTGPILQVNSSYLDRQSYLEGFSSSFQNPLIVRPRL
ncbi:hypothetical protein PCASD_08182 [Puccinia coronata f. sp. avenae]|uniref:Uncharacterized protein n=1 Tax=Puccinia coronata f. sp. avenae TaxID=200324 RepID=A0A2N5VCA2_9BASI|nr:hypothetical protein PCASD_08182 [Puccinia coronata f. sp. avenae]